MPDTFRASEQTADAATAQRPEAAGAQGTDLASLLTQLGIEVAGPLTQALDRLHQQLDEAEPGDEARHTALLGLRDPLRRARDATLLAAQVGRLRSGSVQAKQEGCALHQVLQMVVDVRRHEAGNRGLQLRLDLVEAEAMSDSVLLPDLLHALLDWALWHTRSSIDIALSLGDWPAQARLSCRFALRDLDQVSKAQPPELDDLRWMLLAHTAQTLGAHLQREDQNGVCVTQLEFPMLQHDLSFDWSQPKARLGRQAPLAAQGTQPFAGWPALVVSSQPEFQDQIAAQLEPQGWALKQVSSVDEAFRQYLDALPKAIVVDGQLAGPDLKQWRTHVLAEAPGFCFVEVGQPAKTALPRTQEGLFCASDRLAADLQPLLNEALDTPKEGLTFRL